MACWSEINIYFILFFYASQELTFSMCVDGGDDDDVHVHVYIHEHP